MLGLGWLLFAIECAFSIFFVLVFWHFWTHSAMKRSVAVKAILIYSLGCLVFLSLMIFLPI